MFFYKPTREFPRKLPASLQMGPESRVSLPLRAEQNGQLTLLRIRKNATAENVEIVSKLTRRLCCARR